MMARMIYREPTYAELGYSNRLVGWFGETVVRGLLDDERLAQQGGVADDILLTALLVTEGTSYIDPTPVSDLANAGLLVMDGRNEEAGMVMAGAAAPVGLDKVLRAIPFDKLAKHFGDDAVATLRRLDDRATEVHSKLDDIEFRNRTTGVMSTDGGDIIGAGAHDLKAVQRKMSHSDEIVAVSPGVHAEITLLDEAGVRTLEPEAIVTTWNFCPECLDELKEAGAVIVDPRAALFPPLLGN
jgi:hypothetical protein